jgi:hypothetical protein
MLVWAAVITELAVALVVPAAGAANASTANAEPHSVNIRTSARTFLDTAELIW